ncbi:MAG: biotin--[acetyl-CoA-carboxylase] ligase [Ottowia sp.]|nr:biotin--[acetyl-CoA-carboxylase] ligase [Ottowia sp.]
MNIKNNQIESIDATRLRARLPLFLQELDISCVDQTGSTNSDVLQLLREQPIRHTPLLRQAMWQSAGRGRLGRPWLGAARSSLMFSLAWPMDLPLRALSGLSLACGVSLIEALTFGLDTQQAQRLKLKWPNDLLLDGGKVAGLLIETIQTHYCWVVIGVGLNCWHNMHIETQLAHKVSSLDQLHPCLDAEHLLARLVVALAQSLRIFSEQGFAPTRAQWSGYDAYAGQEVDIYQASRCVAQGTVLGVDALGQLQLDTPQGVETILGGEISVRLKQQE